MMSSADAAIADSSRDETTQNPFSCANTGGQEERHAELKAEHPA
jgi:hypothetical protein